MAKELKPNCNPYQNENPISSDIITQNIYTAAIKIQRI